MQDRHCSTTTGLLYNKARKPVPHKNSHRLSWCSIWQIRRDCVQDSIFPAHCNTKAFPYRTEPEGQAVSLGDVVEGVGDHHTLLRHWPTQRVWISPIKCLLKVPVVATFLIYTQPQPGAKQPLAEALLFPSGVIHQSLSSRTLLPLGLYWSPASLS